LSKTKAWVQRVCEISAELHRIQKEMQERYDLWLVPVDEEGKVLHFRSVWELEAHIQLGGRLVQRRTLKGEQDGE
jgi:hypothetical protein